MLPRPTLNLFPKLPTIKASSLFFVKWMEGIMKKIKSNCIWILALSAFSFGAAAEVPNKTVLPDDFKVYQSQKVGLSTKSFKGATEKTVPTNNEYKDSPGCYVSCHSKHSKDAA